MANILSRAVTFLRDTLSGRRRLARYTDPESHRRTPNVPTSPTVERYRPPDIGGGPF